MNPAAVARQPPARCKSAGRALAGLSGGCVCGAALLAIAIGALAFRAPRLGARPMHADEGNQAVRTGLLLETGHYRYDPREHHGPSLYWIAAASLRLRGISQFAATSEFDYRIVPAVFGAGLVLLVPLLSGGLGRSGALAAALLLAVSPAMVFYSRYYIQEMLLAFFTLAAIASAWQSARTRSPWWAVACGACFGLMHATKETWVLAAAAMAVGLALALAWSRWRDGRLPDLRLRVSGRSLALAACAAVLVSTLVYSSFGADWRGTIDSILAYGTYFQRGREGGIHAHPWHYYLQLLAANRPGRGFFWSEGLIVGLAVVGAAASLASSGRRGSADYLGRFLALYTLALTALYSALPYKTPWCLVSFLTGMILLAGAGAAAIVRWTPTSLGKSAAIALFLAGTAQLGWQSYQLNFRFQADTRNPYVYAHTSTDLVNLAAQLERLAQVSPAGRAMVVHVVTAENYWPLPWYLRKSAPNSVGYWDSPSSWSSNTASRRPPEVILTTPDEAPAVDRLLRAVYDGPMLYGLRPGVLLGIYVRGDLWQAFLAAQAPEVAPAAAGNYDSRGRPRAIGPIGPRGRRQPSQTQARQPRRR
jgi:uncharacterized protein (TIGR03663 family)